MNTNYRHIYTIKNNNNYIKFNNNIIGFKKYWSVLYTKYSIDQNSIKNIKFIKDSNKIVIPKYYKENYSNFEIETLQFSDFLMIPFQEDNNDGIVILDDFQESKYNIILNIEKTIDSL